MLIVCLDQGPIDLEGPCIGFIREVDVSADGRELLKRHGAFGARRGVLLAFAMAPGRKTLLYSSRRTRWTLCWPRTPTTLRQTTKWWKEAEAAAVEVESVHFPEFANRKDDATLRGAVAEEVLVPQGEHLIHGGVSDRFRQSSGRLRLVSSPLWSLRLPMCPL